MLCEDMPPPPPEKTFPFRLRTDWAHAYTGHDGGSELPTKLTEDKARNFILAAAKFSDFFKEHPETDRVLDHLTQLPQTKNVYPSGLIHQSTSMLLNLNTSLRRYIEEHAIDGQHPVRAQSGEDIQKWGRAVRKTDIISSRPELSFLGFLQYWTTETKPQYTQASLLHVGDALDAIQTAHPDESPAIRQIRNVYAFTGLKKASDAIRAITKRETPDEEKARKVFAEAIYAIPPSAEAQEYVDTRFADFMPQPD